MPAPPANALNIAIAGAGIGGLSAAIALSLNGHKVTIFERATQLSDVGAGIQISPNGYHVLKALGVIEALAPHLFYPEAIEMYLGQSGHQIFSLPIQDVSKSRWNAPYIHIHRADLVSVLAHRLTEIAPNALHLNSEISEFENHPSGISIRHKNGALESFDLLIGADGVHSAIRGQIHGADAPCFTDNVADAPRFTGNVAWRATLPLSSLVGPSPPPSAAIWVGHKCHAVTTRIRGGGLVNFVGIIEQDGWEEDGWHITGDRQEALQYFGHWKTTIAEIVTKAPQLHKWALLDRAPLSFWSKGRATLLGDAAHPMLPSMAQGAVQAMEDGFVLAKLLTEKAIDDALKAYYDVRIERVSKIQKGSRDNSALFHRATPLRGALTYGPMFCAGKLVPNLIHHRQDWIYNHDVTKAQ